jgi:chromosome partitioning protein
VLNQTPVRGRRIDNAAHALGGEEAREMIGLLARPFISMRNDHQDALASGLAVSEYAPTGKSAEEIRELWRWTDARLNGETLERDVLSRATFPPALTPRAAQTAEAAAAQPLPASGEGLTPWDACL